jgi:molybdopterin-binding protein
VTAVITKEAVEDLDLKVGDEVVAIVKSTEVIIGK